jgi:hypothetical protein
MLLGLFACQSEPRQPETPEEVLQMYQQYIDKNEFNKAKTLSTPAGQEWLAELASIIEDEQPDSTILTTNFISIDCKELEGGALRCECVLEDEYEKYTAEYRLIKSDGQWLVDAPQDDIIIENDIIEALPDSLIEEIIEEEVPE